jgi:fluoride exporter
VEDEQPAPGRRPRSRPADPRALAAIFAGGMAGAAVRTGLSQVAPTAPGQWPWVTFAVNVAGCFLLGYFVTRLQERLPVTAYRRPFVGTGFCGALTTFSTFQVDLLKLLDHGAVGLAAAYGVASVAGGFAGMMLGTALVRRARLTW